MNAQTTYDTTRTAAFARGIGLHGHVAVSWAAAGGILLGGVLVALMSMSGRLSGHGLFFTVSGLFVIGAALGLIHGVALGYFGRPADVRSSRASGDLARSLLYAVPALAVAWLVTIWVGMTLVASYLDRTLPLIGVGLAWGASVVVLATAGVLGVRALRNAYARWPERRAGTALVATSFAALLVIFLADRPEIWGLRLRVTEVGAVLLAAFLTFWVAGPAVTLALRFLREVPIPRPRLPFMPGAHAGADVALGLAVGAVLGVLAVPFLGVSPATAGGAGSVVAALGQAVVDEVLLRLVLLTGLAWVLLRWHRIHREEAAVLAVGATAVIQLLIYIPGLAAAGFPTTLALATTALMTIAVPAVAFGILYWTRGFGAALVADATAVVAVLAL